MHRNFSSWVLTNSVFWGYIAGSMKIVGVFNMETAMRINPETLKMLRNGRGFSQETLAEASGVAKKTIARIETGKGGETRENTARELANALRVKDVEVLAKEPESEEARREELGKLGLLPIKLLLDGETLLAYDLVEKEYGFDMKSLIHAAPLLFTLLAEMSLADRRRRLEKAREAAESANEALPEYLPEFAWPYSDADKESIDTRDVFGARIGKWRDGYWDGDGGRSPFSDFLVEQVKNLGDNDAINHEEILYEPAHELDSGHSGYYKARLFKKFRESLSGGSLRADYALTRRYVRITQIPEELRGEAKDTVAKRVKWLEAKVPDEVWDEYESSMIVKISLEEGDTNNV